MLILKPELLKALMFEEYFQHNKSASNFDFILGKTWSNSLSKQKQDEIEPAHAWQDFLSVCLCRRLILLWQKFWTKKKERQKNYTEV